MRFPADKTSIPPASPELARGLNAEDTLAEIDRLAGRIAALGLWACLAGFLIGAGCATVLTLAYLGASR
jgi:hypothetical protein